MKKAILIVNLGTPDSPARGAVRRYLTEFLNDPYVIDLPQPWRWMLVNLIIIPFRVNKSTGLYRRVWTPEGSPILCHLLELRDKLTIRFAQVEAVKVYAAMRYGSPSLEDALRQIQMDGMSQLTVLPLYPQYAESTTETIFNLVRQIQSQLHPSQMEQWPGMQNVSLIKQFYDHPAFINAFAERMKAYNPASFDHVIFSFHSLPERHLNRLHPEFSCAHCGCEQAMPIYGGDCYKATAYHTARQLASAYQLSEANYSIAFQSRFARKWIGPFTEDRIRELALQGAKRVLVVAPSFVADCLETLVEIGMDYRKLFINCGGEELVMAESLNSEDYWVNAVALIIKDLAGNAND